MKESSYVLVVSAPGAETRRLEAYGPLGNVLDDAERLLAWEGAPKITIRDREGQWIATVTPPRSAPAVANDAELFRPGDSAGGPAARA